MMTGLERAEALWRARDELAAAADEMAVVGRAMFSVADDAGWRSRAGTAFRERAEELADAASAASAEFRVAAVELLAAGNRAVLT
ncbi:hypothetical protein [Microbacterium excoecariae]|uniref:hypothetical protein n=1 Tax=Microbacterium excoecariae TaxID=2715210 RepID=UPI00140DC608|nr:hypothetical protein [Microbacterium excoecariae]NHI16044.1 hypothetical protein [Microbacterium excoecariae]